MTPNQILTLVLIQLLILLLPAFGAAKMFAKAGVPPWKAWIPFYNTYIMLELAGRPTHWVYWQLIPVVGWFISMGIFIDFVKAFGKFRLLDHTLAALLPVLYFPYIGSNKDDRYLGPSAVQKYKKTTVREWIDAGVFAVVAATLIRTFVFEAYTIPTPSMEKTLLVNDFLFVSKFSYGPRIPNTPLAMPFVHHTMPITGTKSYVEWLKIPYTRWFASPVKRNDVVVFNFPAGDTVIDKEGFQSEVTYYQMARTVGGGDMNAGRQAILNDPDEYPIIVYPVDKQENFIKRCIGVAGDSLQIKDQVVYINGKRGDLPPFSQTNYTIITKGQPLDETVMKEEYDIDMSNPDEFQQSVVPNHFTMLLTNQAKDKMIRTGFGTIIPQIDSGRGVFPNSPRFNWTLDNYGPFWIPKKGATITLTPENYAMYERVIRTNEGNTIDMQNDRFIINGRETNQYTFKMDYYWMMGDNRHQSADSRIWGFVPEDHVVGEAWVIWMSWNKGVRWKRLFNRIK